MEEYKEIAQKLYSEGWRTYQLNEIQTKFNHSEDEAEIICEWLTIFELNDFLNTLPKTDPNRKVV